MAALQAGTQMEKHMCDGLKALIKVIIRLLKAHLKVLLKVMIRLLKARLKVLLKVLIRLRAKVKPTKFTCASIATGVWCWMSVIAYA